MSEQTYKDRLIQAVINQFEQDIEEQDYSAIDELIDLIYQHGGGRWLHGYVSEFDLPKWQLETPVHNEVQGIRNLVSKVFEELKTQITVLFTNDDIVDENGDENDTIYDYPSCSRVDKYGYYESGVIRELRGDKILMHRTGEYNGSPTIEIPLAELTTDELLTLKQYLDEIN